MFDAQVYPSGSLRFVSKSGKAPGSCFGPKPTTWEGEDVIGASVSDQSATPTVYVYHCPAKIKDGHSVRQVKKAGPFHAADKQQAMQFAEEIRNANNRHGDLQIGGKTVLAVVRFTHASATCALRTCVPRPHFIIILSLSFCPSR
jgi:hypothetical protein